MSRSRPTDNAPNPAVRWFEWNGEAGSVRYYDKEKKERIDLGRDFTFILLDELATVTGYHELSQSGIYANEVRDTRRDVLVVKARKEGTLAEGLYKDIKDRINVAGGGFTANCYIAFKRNDALTLGAVQWRGAALGAWMDFRKAHRAELYKKAVTITGAVEGKKGRVVFQTPTFALKDISEQTNVTAAKLDEELQAYLDGYLKRTTREQIDTAPEPTHVRDEDMTTDPAWTPTADDIPF